MISFYEIRTTEIKTEHEDKEGNCYRQKSLDAVSSHVEHLGCLYFSRQLRLNIYSPQRLWSIWSRRSF